MRIHITVGQDCAAKTFIHGAAECVRVREEDLDWKLYHILAADPSKGEEELAAIACVSSDTIRSSLERLVAAYLLERVETGYRVLTIQEMLLRCQAKYDKSCPFFLENGVLKMKSMPDTRDE